MPLPQAVVLQAQAILAEQPGIKPLDLCSLVGLQGRFVLLMAEISKDDAGSINDVRFRVLLDRLYEDLGGQLLPGGRRGDHPHNPYAGGTWTRPEGEDWDVLARIIRFNQNPAEETRWSTLDLLRDFNTPVDQVENITRRIAAEGLRYDLLEDGLEQQYQGIEAAQQVARQSSSPILSLFAPFYWRAFWLMEGLLGFPDYESTPGKWIADRLCQLCWIAMMIGFSVSCYPMEWNAKFMIAVVLFKVFIVFYAKFLFPILDGNRGQIPLNDDPILPLDPEYWVGEFRRDFDRPVQSVERSWQIGGTLLTLVVILVAVDACGIL